MRTLYLDCAMGAAGDMLSAALLGLFPDAEKMLGELNAMGIPHVRYFVEESVKCGIRGLHVSVKIDGKEEHHHDSHEHHDHHHSGMEEIRAIVNGLRVPEKVRGEILSVYETIAAAESTVHGVPVAEVHFHEVGMLDAIADVAAACYLMDLLAVDWVIASPIHVGSGTVHCAHGILPVPAPATAELLRGVPIYGGEISGELCTPTGAALITHFADEFGAMPPMCVDAIGYGMGRKDFPRANCLRAMLGESEINGRDMVYELKCNLDDMTGEEIGFAEEMLFHAGALDVSTIPIGMKKSRPGILLLVLCRQEDREKMIDAIFRYTTTLGVRETLCARSTLEREVVNTAGAVRRKVSRGYGIERAKYEYDDLAKIAREREISLREAREIMEIDS